jgi:hypothetical protein
MPGRRPLPAARYLGSHDHPPRHQELPAVFLNRSLGQLVIYEGAAPWTGGELKRLQPGWPNK